MNPYVLLINMYSMNSYDQEATTAEFGKLGVNLFFLFFPLACFSA